jgi:Plavaka transposase
VIVSSDETKLSQFGGDKKAWPVYLTIGNIEKAVRRKTSSQATILIGYLPTSKLECFSESKRGAARWRVFHHCMEKIMRPLIQARKVGVNMVCADGYVRRVHPILAAYVADYPEQCLVACCMSNRCPKCRVSPDRLGENRPGEAPLRNHEQTKKVLIAKGKDIPVPEFNRWGLHPINSPFWQHLPHWDIFSIITPDLLHQLHKGMFKDHLVKWCMKIVRTEREIDERFKAMVSHPGLRYFKTGISKVEQWTGKEIK